MAKVAKLDLDFMPNKRFCIIRLIYGLKFITVQVNRYEMINQIKYM